MSPESPSNSIRLETDLNSLSEAAGCVRRAIRSEGNIRAVRLTTLHAIHAKVGDDVRMLTDRFNFDKFIGDYGQIYEVYDRFEVRLEDMLPPATSVDQKPVRVAVIICLNEGESINDYLHVQQ